LIIAIFFANYVIGYYELNFKVLIYKYVRGHTDIELLVVFSNWDVWIEALIEKGVIVII